jgi:sirohydrochlorin cobaltochelatase
MNEKTANILLAHGSRDPKWKIPFQDMTQAIKQHEMSSLNPSQEMIVELAYMELCEPSLESMCEKLFKQGIEVINIYPVFFAAGIHLRVDVPKQLKAIEAEFGVRTKLHPPVGQEKAVQDAITQVILERL